MDDELAMEEELVFEDVDYKGALGSLTLADKVLHYRANPPSKKSVKLSWPLITKLQIGPRSAAKQHFTVVTQSGKSAKFFVKDRTTLEEVRGSIKERIAVAKQVQASKNAAAALSLNPLQRMLQEAREWYWTNNHSAGAPGQTSSSSEASRRLLAENDPETQSVALLHKYASEIQQDPELKALNQKIQQVQIQLRQQMRNRQTWQAQKAQLERDQIIFQEQNQRLLSALQEISKPMDPDDTTTRRYTLMRRDYTKAVEKASASTKKVSASAYALGSTNTSREENRKLEREALRIETTLCQALHYQMVLQNQHTIAQKNQLIVRGQMERAKEEVEAEYNRDKLLLDSILETDANLVDHYNDLIVRQEALLDKMQSKPPQEQAESHPTLILSKTAMRSNYPKRPSVAQSDGVSDLGESLVNGETPTKQNLQPHQEELSQVAEATSTEFNSVEI